MLSPTDLLVWSLAIVADGCLTLTKTTGSKILTVNYSKAKESCSTYRRTRLRSNGCKSSQKQKSLSSSHRRRWIGPTKFKGEDMDPEAYRKELLRPAEQFMTTPHPEGTPVVALSPSLMAFDNPIDTGTPTGDALTGAMGHESQQSTLTQELLTSYTQPYYYSHDPKVVSWLGLVDKEQEQPAQPEGDLDRFIDNFECQHSGSISQRRDAQAFNSKSTREGLDIICCLRPTPQAQGPGRFPKHQPFHPSVVNDLNKQNFGNKPREPNLDGLRSFRASQNVRHVFC